KPNILKIATLFDGVVVVIVLCLCTEALGVQVNVEGVSFPLEAVKQLKKLFNLDEKIPELTKKDVEDVCANRDLPQVFKPVCQEEGRQAVFSNLVRIPLEWFSLHRCALSRLVYGISCLPNGVGPIGSVVQKSGWYTVDSPI
uniref:Guanylate cyclase activator 2B n=1 Tax=Amphiprion ocellaris TaxID=80972 RepID=A0A3Q1BFC5_AMPOC